MAIQWSLNIENGCPIFVIAGEPTAADADRLTSAANWVAGRHKTPVVLDLYYVWGFKPGGEALLGDCVDRLTPPGVVLYLARNPLLTFDDERLLAPPRIHRLSEAPEALVNLARRNARKLTP
jgi:hypothetical protein